MRVPLSLSVLAAVMFLLSCGARRVADVLDIEVGPQFSGPVEIKACRAGHPNTLSISVNDHGVGETGECSFSDQIRIRLHRADRVVEIPPQDVHLRKTGDGFVTVLQFEAPRS
jgi:hypothetical protein